MQESTMLRIKLAFFQDYHKKANCNSLVFNNLTTVFESKNNYCIAKRFSIKMSAEYYDFLLGFILAK